MNLLGHMTLETNIFFKKVDLCIWATQRPWYHMLREQYVDIMREQSCDILKSWKENRTFIRIGWRQSDSLSA